MTPDAGQHVIICRSYGNFDAYECTLANARAILENYLGDLCTEIRTLHEALSDKSKKGDYLVVKTLVDESIKEILTLDVGASTRHLRKLIHGGAPGTKSGQADERPEVLVTQALKDELVLWAFKVKKEPQKLTGMSADELSKLEPHKTLSFLAGVVERAKGRPLVYADGWALDAAQELQQLQTGTWKADAAEHRVVQRYLQFVREYLVDRSDTDYDVTELRATY